MESAKKPNIIHITFDSGRPDHMGIGGYPRDTMPFLDSLARKGVWFKHAFATGPGSSVSFTGIFTSTYSLDYGGYGYIDRPRVLFPEVLQKAGYTTIGIHSSPYLSEYFGYNRGWSVFRYVTHFRSAGSPMSPGLRRGTVKSRVLKRTAAGQRWLRDTLPLLGILTKITERFFLTIRKVVKDLIRFTPAFFVAEEINAEVKKIIEEIPQQPIFLWIHYLDAHAPYGLFYRKGRGLWSTLKYHTNDLLGFLFSEFPRINKFFMPLYMSVYDDSLRYVDENIKQLFELLRRHKILDEDAVVIIHADHGEEFLEHDSFGHPQTLFNVNVHVPLIFYAPSRFSSPKVIEQPVSLIDIAPTILEFGGASSPDVFKGKNIFRAEDRDVVVQASESAGDLSDCRFTGIAIISRGYKLIRWKEEKLLFALEDRAERENLYDKEKGIVQELEKRVFPYLPTDEYESSVPGWPPKSAPS